MRTAASVIALSLACTSSAFAGNVAPPVEDVFVAPPAAAVNDWGGFYVGGMAGSASGTQTYENPDFFYDLEPEITYGGFLGYNVQSGAFVFGGELAYSSGGVSPIGFLHEDHLYFADVKARAGYSLGNAMVFGFAGWTSSSFDNTVEVTTLSGMNYGAGIDFFLGSNMFAGVEYIVRDLTGPGNSATPAQTRNSAIGAVQARIGWNF